MAIRKYNNIDMTVPRFGKNKCNTIAYTNESIMDVLSCIAFDKVNIPLYSYRNLIRNDDDQRGNIAVGYISGYDPKTNEFSVVVHEKYANFVLDFKDPIIYPRVQVLSNDVVRILGFDICPKLYYAYIR